MGRPRTFDPDDVITAATDVFITRGYEGASIDRLVEATGIHRASLYGAFGSKLGLFLACLAAITEPGDDRAVDLLLVALLELAPTDPTTRLAADHLVGELTSTQHLSRHAAAGLLGTRLLARAHLSS